MFFLRYHDIVFGKGIHFYVARIISTETYCGKARQLIITTYSKRSNLAEY